VTLTSSGWREGYAATRKPERLAGEREQADNVECCTVITMVRAQIPVDRETYEQAKEEAKRRGVAAAQ